MPDLTLSPPIGEEPSQTNGMELRPSVLDPLGVSNSIQFSNAGVPSDKIPTTVGESFAARNQRNGVPIDITEGVPFLKALETKLSRTLEGQKAVLERAYGAGNVRFSDTGEPLVTVSDQSSPNGFKEVPLDPEGLSGHDAASILAQAPEIIGGFLAASKGNEQGVINGLKNLVRMAAGSQGAGALKDVLFRGLEGQPIDLPEIGKERAKGMGFDVATGAGLGILAKGGTKMLAPFNNPGPIQYDLRQGIDYLNQRFGETFTPSIGEISGNKLLLRSEAFARQLPGSSAVFDSLVNQQNKQIANIQRKALGIGQDEILPSAEQVGEQAMGTLGAKTLPLVGNVEKAKTAALKTGIGEVGAVVGALPEIGKSQNDLGQFVRDSALQKRSLWKATSGYDEFFKNPITTDLNFPADDLAQGARDIVDKIAKSDNITQQASPIIGPNGQPITKTASGTTTWREFVPPGVLPILDRLSQLNGAKTSLDSLKQARTDIGEMILTGQAVPGVKTHYLNDIRNLLTEQMDKAVKSFNDPALETQWSKINSAYAENVKQFEQKGVMELFREKANGNWLYNEEIVQRAKESPDLYRTYKAFFGPESVEVKGLQRSQLEDVLGPSELRNTPVQASEMQARWRQSIAKNRELTADAVGSTGTEVVGETLGLLNKIAKSENISDTLSPDEFQNLIAKGTPTYKAAYDFLAAKQTLADQYSNTILRKISTDTFNPSEINPSEFVSYVMHNPKTPPEDVKTVMQALGANPEVEQAVRRQALLQIFDQAQQNSGATINQLAAGEKEMTGSGIRKAMGLDDVTKAQSDKIRTVIGDTAFEDLSNMAKVLTPREVGQASFKTAGRLAAGAQTGKLVHGGIVDYAANYGKSALLSFLYSNPVTRKVAASNLLTPAEAAVAINTTIASTPFIEWLMSDVGAHRAKDIVAAQKTAVDGLVRSASGYHPTVPTVPTQTNAPQAQPLKMILSNPL